MGTVMPDSADGGIFFDRINEKYNGGSINAGTAVLEFWELRNFSNAQIENLRSVGFKHKSSLIHHVMRLVNDPAEITDTIDKVRMFSERNMRGRIIDESNEVKLEDANNEIWIARMVIDDGRYYHGWEIKY